MLPDDYTLLPKSEPPIHRVDPAFSHDESRENDLSASLIPQAPVLPSEFHSHISRAPHVTYRHLEESEQRAATILELFDDNSHLIDHLRSLIDRSEDFINFLIVKQARALNFGEDITVKTYEKRMVEMGLQFLKSDTLEWQLDFANFLDLSQDASPSATGAAGLDFTVAFLNSLGHAGSIFLMGIHLSKAKEVLELKKEALKQIKDDFERQKLIHEINTLSAWIETNRNIVIHGLKSEGVALAVSTPKLLSALTSLAAGAGTTTAAVFDWMGIGLDLISSAFHWKKAHSDQKQQAKWAEAFRGTSMIRGSDLTKAKMEDLQLKQKHAHSKKLELNMPKLVDKTKEVLMEQLDGVEFPVIIDKLKKIGWELPEDVQTPADVEAFIAVQVHKEAANEHMVRRSEGLSVSLRNAFRSLADVKSRIDKGFIKLRLNRAKTLFGSASFLTGLMIALKLAAVAGVALAASALIFVGYGMLVVTVGAIVVGAIYLKVKKPNLFKEHMKGVKTRLLIRKVPLIIQNFRLQRTTMESSNIATSRLVNNIQKAEIESLLSAISKGDTPEITEDIKERIKGLKKAKSNEKVKIILDRALEDLKKKIEVETVKFDSLNKKIEKLKESVDKHDAVAKLLQERLIEAGWKDYLWKLGKNHAGYDENIVFDIAEALMNDPDLLDDPETKQLLDHLQINLEHLRKLPESADQLFEMASAIATFFGTDDEDTINSIRARKMMVRYG